MISLSFSFFCEADKYLEELVHEMIIDDALGVDVVYIEG